MQPMHVSSAWLATMRSRMDRLSPYWRALAMM
jgi:hypothetical protein